MTTTTPTTTPPAAVVAKLRTLDSGAVSDALDALGLTGHAAGITRHATSRPIAGAVVPVRLAPASEARSKSHLGTAAVDSAGPDHVIVMANEGRTEMGGWGGVLSAGAKRNGVAGVIVDGACRDIDEARELDFPVFARGLTPVTARGRIAEDATGVPVEVGGVRVNPGDYVVADGAGVVFIPADRVSEVLEIATRIVAKETSMIARVDAGDRMEAVMGRDYDTMLKGQTS